MLKTAQIVHLSAELRKHKPQLTECQAVEQAAKLLKRHDVRLISFQKKDGSISTRCVMEGNWSDYNVLIGTGTKRTKNGTKLFVDAAKHFLGMPSTITVKVSRMREVEDAYLV